MLGALLTALHVLAPPAAALAYPGAVASWYMDTVNASVLFDMGCALGTARKGGSAPQDALVILDYGQPQLRNGVYGSFDFSSTYRTVGQIRAAALEYAHGFYVCTGANLTAHVRLAVGTSNFGNFSVANGLTGAGVTGHGKAWADMVDGLNGDIAARGYASQADAVGAADIEVSWGTSAVGRLWVDGYDAVNSWPMYDYGDAAGCPQFDTGRTARRCGSSSWFQDDLYYVAYGAPAAWGVPEIYVRNGAQARQWQQISKWASLNGKSRILFAGTLTQRGACGADCAGAGTDNPPDIGWAQLNTECASDPATALGSLRFAADIRWH
jgi:hypothetical protein